MLYWEDDQGTDDTSTLSRDGAVPLHIRHRVALYDGERATEKLQCDGRRISITWYCLENSCKIPEALREELDGLGYYTPENEASCCTAQWFPQPLGYDIGDYDHGSNGGAAVSAAVASEPPPDQQSDAQGKDGISVDEPWSVQSYQHKRKEGHGERHKAKVKQGDETKTRLQH